jgi:hypothetical protein
MGFALLQVIAVRVVHRMAAGPAVVGHQQQAVQGEAHSDFKPAVGVEGVVAAFVGNDPQARGHRSCGDAIDQPERGGPELQGDLGAEGESAGRQAQRHGQAAPGLDGINAGKLLGQGGEQHTLAGVGILGVRLAGTAWGRVQRNRRRQPLHHIKTTTASDLVQTLSTGAVRSISSPGRSKADWSSGTDLAVLAKLRRIV